MSDNVRKGLADEDSKSDDEEKHEPIKINLQRMLTKLPQPDDKKTEQEYKREYIDTNNNEGELFTEVIVNPVHRVGGRTQKKKKRVQNRRRQKTIKNKV
jgi:hypothetical protein